MRGGGACHPPTSAPFSPAQLSGQSTGGGWAAHPGTKVDVLAVRRRASGEGRLAQVPFWRILSDLRVAIATVPDLWVGRGRCALAGCELGSHRRCLLASSCARVREWRGATRAVILPGPRPSPSPLSPAIALTTTVTPTLTLTLTTLTALALAPALTLASLTCDSPRPRSHHPRPQPSALALTLASPIRACPRDHRHRHRHRHPHPHPRPRPRPHRHPTGATLTLDPDLNPSTLNL